MNKNVITSEEEEPSIVTLPKLLGIGIALFVLGYSLGALTVGTLLQLAGGLTHGYLD